MGRATYFAFALFGLFLFATMPVDTFDSFAYITGQVTSEPAKVVLESVVDEPPKLIKTTAECCNFIGDDGREKTCFALNNQDCSFCAKIC